MAATQEALYGELDLALSWSERELPERERTKHVHRLHPYLGKFVPQLVEAMLERYVRPGGRVLDPFAGSGTTLVQALESGYDAVGVDIAAFNALLISVKTREHDLEALAADVRDVSGRLGRVGRAPDRLRPRLVRAAGGRRAAPLPLADPGVREHGTCFASSSRAPRAPRGSRRTSTSTSRARRSRASTGATSTVASAGRSRAPASSSRRYLADTAARIAAFAEVRDPRPRRSRAPRRRTRARARRAVRRRRSRRRRIRA